MSKIFQLSGIEQLTSPDARILLVDPPTLVVMQREERRAGNEVVVSPLDIETEEGIEHAAKKLCGAISDSKDRPDLATHTAVKRVGEFLAANAGDVIPVEISALCEVKRVETIGAFLSNVMARAA